MKAMAFLCVLALIFFSSPCFTDGQVWAASLQQLQADLGKKTEAALGPQNMRVLASRLMVRNGPSVGNAAVASLARGTEISVLGLKNTGEEFPWCKIRFGRKGQGWVYGAYLENKNSSAKPADKQPAEKHPADKQPENVNAEPGAPLAPALPPAAQPEERKAAEILPLTEQAEEIKPAELLPPAAQSEEVKNTAPAEAPSTTVRVVDAQAVSRLLMDTQKRYGATELEAEKIFSSPLRQRSEKIPLAQGGAAPDARRETLIFASHSAVYEQGRLTAVEVWNGRGFAGLSIGENQSVLQALCPQFPQATPSGVYAVCNETQTCFEFQVREDRLHSMTYTDQVLASEPDNV